MGRVTWLCWAAGYLAAVAFIARWMRTATREEEPTVCRFEVLHLVPRGDCIEHVCGGEECICGPTVQPIRRDGGWQWIAQHHALWVQDVDA